MTLIDCLSDHLIIFTTFHLKLISVKAKPMFWSHVTLYWFTFVWQDGVCKFLFDPLLQQLLNVEFKFNRYQTLISRSELATRENVFLYVYDLSLLRCKVIFSIFWYKWYQTLIIYNFWYRNVFFMNVLQITCYINSIKTMQKVLMMVSSKRFDMPKPRNVFYVLWQVITFYCLILMKFW